MSGLDRLLLDLLHLALSRPRDRVRHCEGANVSCDSKEPSESGVAEMVRIPWAYTNPSSFRTMNAGSQAAMKRTRKQL
jgi:hypothetical protein